MKAIKKLLVIMNKVTAYYRHSHNVNAIPEKAMIDMCNAQIDAEKEIKELEQQNEEIIYRLRTAYIESVDEFDTNQQDDYLMGFMLGLKNAIAIVEEVISDG